MSLYNKIIKNIEIEDIISFCMQGIEEGIRVEYKSDWPDNKKLAREIASFANTYGGLILIGVAEEDRKPIFPLLGVDSAEGIDEKVTSIALKSINPPVFPEIKSCQIKDNPRKSVIVIRVHESNDTPHRVEQDTKIYIRTSSQKEPVLAPFEEIEWLMHRKKKAIANRERLLSRAKERFFEKYKTTGYRPVTKTERAQVGIGAHQVLSNYKSPPTRGISIIPLYPHKEVINYLELKKVIDISVVRTNVDSFPREIKPVVLQDSMIYSESGNMGVSHAEINSFGLIFHKEDFSLDERNQLGAKNVIAIDLTGELIYSALLFARRFFEGIGYWGMIQVNVTFEEIRGMSLYVDKYAHPVYKNEFDNGISIGRKTTVLDLADNDNLDETLIDIYRRFLWSFGAQFSDDDVRRGIEKIKQKFNQV